MTQPTGDEVSGATGGIKNNIFIAQSLFKICMDKPEGELTQIVVRKENTMLLRIIRFDSGNNFVEATEIKVGCKARTLIREYKSLLHKLSEFGVELRFDS